MKASVFTAVGKRIGAGLAVLSLTAALSALAAQSSQAADKAELAKIRFGGDGDATRIVMEIGQASQAKVVSSTPTSLVIDLPKIKLGDEDEGRGQGLVRAWSADARPGGVRLQIDLKAPAVIEKRFLLTPTDGAANYRYVIDLKAGEPKDGDSKDGKDGKKDAKPAAADLAAARPAKVKGGAPKEVELSVVDQINGKTSPAAPKSKPAAPPVQMAKAKPTQAKSVLNGPVANIPLGGGLPGAFAFTSRAEASTLQPTQASRQVTLTKRVVVIDAGHGGHDPGALGGALKEKEVTLPAALALKAKLEATGRYKVVMTRASDVFIPLENRVQIARKANADLFISLHADAGGNQATRGTSVYTLSDSGSKRIVRGVSRDSNWFAGLNLSGATQAVREIIMDMTQRATRNQSAQFADVLLQNLSGHVPLLSRAHRDAGFMVLLAPDVPAVLLEMGFITNAEDEKFLSSPEGRNRVASAVADAIDDYFGNVRLAAN